MKRREAVEKAACPNLKVKLAHVPTAPGTSSFITISYHNCKILTDGEGDSDDRNSNRIPCWTSSSSSSHYSTYNSQSLLLLEIEIPDMNIRTRRPHQPPVTPTFTSLITPSRSQQFHHGIETGWILVPFLLCLFLFLLLVFPFRNRTTCNFNLLRQTTQPTVERQVDPRTTILFPSFERWLWIFEAFV